MDAKSKANHARGGFTLVELLAVIVIIGILVAMISAAALKVRDVAKVAAYGMDMAQLSAALEEYKNTFGEYPPDFSDPDAVADHISNIFPDYTGAGPPDMALQDQSSALVFWLGGMPAVSGGTRFIGFSKNPIDPFDDNAARIGPFFKFKAERLGYEGGSCRYFPEEGKNDKVGPYVYFRAQGSVNVPYGGKTWTGVYPQWGSTTPHVDSETNEMIHPSSFQIHAPGIDGVHGPGTSYPSGAGPNGSNYGDDDLDDQTNFSQGQLKNKMP
jgi:prepilin-type N-terminal cleavage/methylation domain-containing protein